MRDSRAATTKAPDRYVRAASPIGDVYVAWSDAGITCLVPVARAARFEQAYVERFGRPVERRTRVPGAVVRVLERGVDIGTGAELEYDFRMVSAFDRAVLEQTLRIPRGEVRSYGQLAADVGAPRAARAVGTALSHNPMPLLIPCHRVIRSDGSIGEWGSGGSEMKRLLLEREGVRAGRGLRRLSSTAPYMFDDTAVSGLP